MKRLIAAFGCGLIFGLGLTLSQMINPAKVLSFLDVFGDWDPSLLLVLGGAVVVSFLGYRHVLKTAHPRFASAFQVPANRRLDTRLATGAVLFGIGWGLVGLCPGPAITALLLGHGGIALFVVSMLGGMVLFHHREATR